MNRATEKHERQYGPRPRHLVNLHFSGVVTVEIDCDPNDDEAWEQAITVAWAAAEPITLSECAQFEEWQVQP